MMDTAVSIEGVSKQYRVGTSSARYRTLREAIVNGVRAPIRNFHHLRRLSSRGVCEDAGTIWALRDISFEVCRGESLGVIGANGAGKSTLLKILSRITRPTAGRAVVVGRVGSLLEVGTGFHPELTGRDNVFLNGAILGMDRASIVRRFDEIVEFAGLATFIDTPVKRYSSGMYLRLAFAVAAHLEPDVLLMDEVLAVGDAEFQKKCLGKVGELTTEGRTTLFVSHNLAAVRRLCNRCIVLDKGRKSFEGPADEAVRLYLSLPAADEGATVRLSGTEGGPLRMITATVLSEGRPSRELPMGGDLTFEVEFATDEPLLDPRMGFVIHAADGTPLLSANNRYQNSSAYSRPLRRGAVRCQLGNVPLMAGRYSVSLYLGDFSQDTHIAENVLTFDVVERDIWGAGNVPVPVTYMWWPVEFHLTETAKEVASA